MLKKTFLIFGLCVFLAGCSGMKPEDFANSKPELNLFEYFEGTTEAWGIFEDRFGTVRRQFYVDITGTIEGDTIVLDEQFEYADGEKDVRIWTIKKTGPNTYEGTASDVIGVANGVVEGNALNWSYDLDLKVGDSTIRVHFNDWMFLQPGGVLINRAYMSKWGIDIGEVSLFFTKPEAAIAAE